MGLRRRVWSGALAGPDRPSAVAHSKRSLIVEHWIGPIVAFVVGLVAVTVLTPVAGRLGEGVVLIDRPRVGVLQKDPIPRSGGYAMVASFLIAVAVSLALFPRTS